MNIQSWLRGFKAGRVEPIARAEAGRLTEDWSSIRLDNVGSVSALSLLETHWDDALLEDQHRRFLNGS